MRLNLSRRATAALVNLAPCSVAGYPAVFSRSRIARRCLFLHVPFAAPGASLAVLPLLFLAPSALAQRVSARDQQPSKSLNQRMAAAEKRYRDALVQSANSDPDGHHRGRCRAGGHGRRGRRLPEADGLPGATTMLAAYKRLLKLNADAESLRCPTTMPRTTRWTTARPCRRRRPARRARSRARRRPARRPAPCASTGWCSTTRRCRPASAAG